MPHLSNSNNLTFSLTEMSLCLSNYFAVFLFTFGLIGNILNSLVLSQRSLRSNSCAWLFLISSVFNLISIISGLSSRVLSNWIVDLTDRSDWLCKSRVFILLNSRTIAMWLLTLATLDRWLLSCADVRYRLLSKLRNAQRGAFVIILFSSVAFFPIFFCYKANLTNSPLKCYSSNIHCRIYIDQTYMNWTVVWPLVLMIVFGFLTMSNIRRIHYRARVSLLIDSTIRYRVSQEHHQRLKSIDRHLLIMLLVQISFLSLFTLPQAIQMIYLTTTTGRIKSPFQIKVEHSIFTFALLLTYLASGMPFYVYTLSGGRIFREAFYMFLKNFVRFVRCQKK